MNDNAYVSMKFLPGHRIISTPMIKTYAKSIDISQSDLYALEYAGLIKTLKCQYYQIYSPDEIVRGRLEIKQKTN
jgi:hypothetical protein